MTGRDDWRREHRRLAVDLALMILGVAALLVAYAIVMPALHVHDRAAVLLLLVGVACPVAAALFLTFKPSKPPTERDKRLAEVDMEIREKEGKLP